MPSMPIAYTRVLPLGAKVGLMFVPPPNETRRAVPARRSRTTTCVPSSAIS